MIEINMQTIETKVDLLITLVQGNGTPEKGILVRLDRVEQTLVLLGKLLTPLYAGLIIQILAVIVLVVSGRLTFVLH